MWRSASGRAAATAAATTTKSSGGEPLFEPAELEADRAFLGGGEAEEIGRDGADEEGVEDERGGEADEQPRRAAPAGEREVGHGAPVPVGPKTSGSRITTSIGSLPAGARMVTSASAPSAGGDDDGRGDQRPAAGIAPPRQGARAPPGRTRSAAPEAAISASIASRTDARPASSDAAASRRARKARSASAARRAVVGERLVGPCREVRPVAVDRLAQFTLIAGHVGPPMVLSARSARSRRLARASSDS